MRETVNGMVEKSGDSGSDRKNFLEEVFKVWAAELPNAVSPIRSNSNRKKIWLSAYLNHYSSTAQTFHKILPSTSLSRLTIPRNSSTSISNSNPSASSQTRIMAPALSARTVDSDSAYMLLYYCLESTTGKPDFAQVATKMGLSSAVAA